MFFLLDARVNATIPKSQELMKEAGKTYDPVTYESARRSLGALERHTQKALI
ncbi:MAG TPA: hypothetical protein VLR90_02625 [Blastocatellia bacterium]|nr:hypothetical protein [Blastocatellia bacterium]